MTFKKLFPQREEGQGLVEYALILVLVAIVVIAILLQLGPQISAVFGQVAAYLSGGGVVTSSGAITSVNAQYTSGFGSTTLTVNVTTSGSTDVTASGNGLASSTKTCAGSCTFTWTGAAVPANGSVTVKDTAGGQGVVAYW